LPVFGDTNHDGFLSATEDSALDVTLNLHGQYSDVASISHSLALAGVDHLGVFSSDLGASGLSNLFNALDKGVDVSLNIDAPAPQNLAQTIDFVDGGLDLLSGKGLSLNATWGDLIKTLHDAGFGNIQIEDKAHVTINDDLSAALYDSGMLHALPDANIQIDAGNNKLLNTTLKAMADLGVDSVTSSQSKLYVELGLNPQDAHTLTDLHDLFSAFGVHQNGSTDLFGGKSAALVMDHNSYDTFNSMGPAGVQQLVGELTKLGFTEIDVLGKDSVEHVVNITAQTPVDVTVQVVGTVTGDLAHVFDPDILHKPIK
jgi:hypothetical protein